jgi:hypothetical protein
VLVCFLNLKKKSRHLLCFAPMALRHWVCWGYVGGKSAKKSEKLPYGPMDKIFKKK